MGTRRNSLFDTLAIRAEFDIPDHRLEGVLMDVDQLLPIDAVGLCDTVAQNL
jgi:hypothetical protein